MKHVNAPAVDNAVFQGWLREHPNSLYAAIETARKDLRYLSWREAKYRAPESIPPEAWWSILSIARQFRLVAPTLVSATGAPFQLSMSDEVQRLLTEIDRAIGENFSIASTTPIHRREINTFRRRYLQRSRALEAISSSQLEGASTTREVARKMLAENREPQNRSEQMILNNYQTICKLEEWAQEPLSEALIFAIHRAVTNNDLPSEKQGRYRRVEEHIVVKNPKDEIAHIPPEATSLPERMAHLIAFANERSATGTPFLHPILRAIVLHTLFAHEHPFVDGNGRTARALFYWKLLSEGYTNARFISLSKELQTRRKEYDQAYVDMETCHFDLTYCLLVNLRAFADGCRHFNDYLERVIAENSRHRDALSGTLNQRQLDLLDHSLRHPNYRYTITEHQHWHAISPNTARADLVDLEAKGFLKGNKTGRTLSFTATPLFLSILSINDKG